MSDSRASSDNNNAISDPAEKDGDESEKIFRHRDAIYAAELSRLSGAAVYSQSEVDARVEALFYAAES